MADARELVLGTHNRKKVAEMVPLLAPLGIGLLTLAEIPNALEVEETGDSFAANAALKAGQQAMHLNRWVLGEDSGLAVDALQGRPGIFSARFSGEGATDEKNNARLLEELDDVPWEKRGAHYVCSAALANPHGRIVATAEGECHGRIRMRAAGGGGFGYDPLFEVVEYHLTFGELSPTVKACLSHRSRALRQLIPQLATLIATGQWPA
ncbi:MAG: RdgB/HAM1 family non-canonical purine NTP pyrophosphatase [Pirellulales bacterium]